jgi:hypothetical protein
MVDMSDAPRPSLMGRTLAGLALLLIVTSVAAGHAAGQAAAGGPRAGVPPVAEELVLVDTREIGAYRVETWATPRDGWAREALVRVVTPEGDPFEVHDATVRFVEQDGREPWEPRSVRYAPGDDLTGDGVPNLLIEGYSLGAHCCFTYHLLALGETLEVVWVAETRDSGIMLVDLKGDGERQVLLADMSFAYAFCAFADSPAPTVVLRLGHEGVTVANAAYRGVYDRTLIPALAGALEDHGDRPEVHRCRVAQLVLQLLYAGYGEAAEGALERLYLGDDAAGFRAALWALAEASPWYRPPGEP